MILVPPVSFVLAGISGFCGSLELAVTIPVPAALLPLLLELELLLLPEHAVSNSVAAAAATRPRVTRVEAVMLRLLEVLGLHPSPDWVFPDLLPARRWELVGHRSEHCLLGGAAAGAA